MLNNDAVSKDEESGRVMVLSNSVGRPAIRVDGVWSVGTFSADDLKDNFFRVEGKEAETLINEARTELSSLPIRDK